MRLTKRMLSLLMFALPGAVCSVALQSQTSHGNAGRKTADLLDRIIAPRFQKNAGVFGMSRAVMEIGGHTRVDASDGRILVGTFKAFGPDEQRLLTEANKIHVDYVIAFAHLPHVAGKPLSHSDAAAAARVNRVPKPISPRARITVLGVKDDRRLHFFRGTSATPAPRDPLGRDTAAKDNLSIVQSIEADAEGAQSRLLAGEKIVSDVAGWSIYYRPIQAESEFCIGCHSGANKGDVLGAMVYAIPGKVIR